MATSRERGLLACSFCGKNEHRVRKLVAGPSSYICDECVAIASRIIEQSDAGDSGRRARGSSRLWGPIRRLIDRGLAKRVALPAR